MSIQNLSLNLFSFSASKGFSSLLLETIIKRVSGIGQALLSLFSQKDTTQEPRLQEFIDEIRLLPETVSPKTELGSFEEGIYNTLYDKSGNSIPATCFEIGSALAILEHPGTAGLHMDRFAQKLIKIVESIYSTEFGTNIVKHSGKMKTLRELFDQKLLHEIRPGSDQIGRCQDLTLKEKWLNGQGADWLCNQLAITSNSKNYSSHNMLTKIRMLSAFGTLIRELIASDDEDANNALAQMLSKDSFEVISERAHQISTQIRHKDFDNKKTRARRERPPIIDGKPLTGRKLQDAMPLNLGFGDVFGPESFDSEESWKYYMEIEKASGGRQGLPRFNQPITDMKRPGVISEFGFKKMSSSFEEINLTDLLARNALEHGTGVNRWEVNGSYAKQTLLNGLPAAGSHSGGTSDILLALNCMNEHDLFGNKEIIYSIGLLISSFMNFGAYHSFNETFPIAHAFGSSEKFEVDAKKRPAIELYSQITQAAQQYTGAGDQVIKFKQAYRKAIQNELSDKKSYDITSNNKPTKTYKGSWEV